MKYHVLASGSKGNCALIKSDDCCIMIDCGCTKKYILEKLQELGMTVNDIDALLLTHEHIDHIRSISSFETLDVYCPFELKERRGESIITPYVSFNIKGLNILPIALSHDTKDTVGFIIEDDEQKLVYVTDTGYISDKNIEYMKDSDYYIIECNHDIATLFATNRPQYLKARIISNYGHLCNEDCAEALCQCVSNRTKEIVLAHISQEGNTTDLAYNTVVETLSSIGINTSNLKITAATQFGLINGGTD